MRLNLYWRGRDIIDIQLHALRRRPDTPAQEGPKLHAAGTVQAERADTFGDPDTIVGFGFGERP